MNTFKVALFDLDGTLMDTEGQYTVFWGKMAAKYRPDVPNLEQIIKGTTLIQIFERYFPDKKWQEEITLALDEWEKQMDYVFIPGALDFVHDIKSHGVRCAIVTSSNIKKMEVVADKVPEFRTLFDRILTSEDFAASKPNPDCYLKGASVFDCKKEECVVFEDAFTGLQAGMSAGIYTIGLATNNSRAQIQDKCNYVIDDFEGLTYDRVAALINE
ncbi:HAD family phosphatase [Prevotella sp. PINT]|jgi:haloacid dehalogenase superfamily, subfamily IA, variant 3 with third motif having DD or ED/haloacid dehalogenase superfamily, subfamily IA, variant 1 with third motif having Dx(3-4)D or Dx(3-4)E|uniref:HAD family hydrolase n=1 Tax=Palleniella intestinalis TaxID=2736291 RepID=UPI00155684F5|nr:HAD family phosphatase [Palleniella intestinalis]NPD80453.1 HAD family phosphatase [Palleniella intestinalis]